MVKYIITEVQVKVVIGTVPKYLFSRFEYKIVLHFLAHFEVRSDQVRSDVIWPMKCECN